MEIDRYALCKLLQLGLIKYCLKLRLPNQKHLQKLVFVGIDIGQHPQGFECARAKILRLVNDKQDSSAQTMLLDQETLKGIVQRHLGLSFIRQTEGQHNPFQQVRNIAMGVIYQPDHMAGFHVVEQMPDQCRLAAADLSADNRKSGPKFYPILHHRVSIPMATPEI